MPRSLRMLKWMVGAIALAHAWSCQMAMQELGEGPKLVGLGEAPELDWGNYNNSPPECRGAATVCRFQLPEDARNQLWPVEEGWHLIGHRYLSQQPGHFTIEIVEARADQVLLSTKLPCATQADTILAIRFPQAPDTARGQIELWHLQGTSLHRLTSAPLPPEAVPSVGVPLHPGWESRGGGSYRLEGPRVVDAWSWNGDQSAGPIDGDQTAQWARDVHPTRGRSTRSKLKTLGWKGPIFDGLQALKDVPLEQWPEPVLFLDVCFHPD